jgi:hypothetical protein
LCPQGEVWWEEKKKWQKEEEERNQLVLADNSKE